MSFYDNEDSYMARGIDYDLYYCLYYNPQDGISIETIERVLAVFEGENDREDWRWILLLSNGKFAYLQGWCDYTGWDCQSNAWSSLWDTPEEAAKPSLKDDRSDWGDNHPTGKQVYTSLLSQLTEGKNKTWWEKKYEEVKDVPKLDKDDLP